MTMLERIAELALAGKSRAAILVDTGTTAESLKVQLHRLRKRGILTHEHAPSRWPSTQLNVKRGTPPADILAKLGPHPDSGRAIP